MIKNFTMTVGNSNAFTLTFTNKAGTALDITGWVIFFTLKTSHKKPDSEVSLQKIITTHTTPASGISALNLEPADTESLEPRTYDYDIKVKTNTGAVYTLLKGKFELEYQVTQTTSTAGTAGT